jgi:hypothetical protein
LATNSKIRVLLADEDYAASLGRLIDAGADGVLVKGEIIAALVDRIRSGRR